MREHPDPPYQFDLDVVTRLVKEVTLQAGGHTPTVFFDSQQGTGMVQIPDFADTHTARAQQMFSIGFALAQTGRYRALNQIFLVSEAWMSVNPQGLPLDHLPSEDPNRKEILMIAGLSVITQQSDLVVIEMIRNQAGDLVELRDMDTASPSDTYINSPLLAAFTLGFDAGKSQPKHD